MAKKIGRKKFRVMGDKRSELKKEAWGSQQGNDKRRKYEWLYHKQDSTLFGENGAKISHKNC